MLHYRIDAYPLKHWEIQKSTGFARFIAPIARTGDLIYLDANGKEYPEFVPHETVIDSMDSFRGLPVTLLHPEEKEVNSLNARKYQRGSTHNSAVFSNDWLWMTGSVTDQEMIDSIVRGDTAEISPGYKAVIKLDNSRKKVTQAKRIGNHIAGVPKGRNGREIRFRLDAEQVEEKDQELILSLQNEFKIDEIDNPPNSLFETFKETDESRPIIISMTPNKTRSLILNGLLN